MSYKNARKELELLYGKGCFMERAGIRIITKEQEEMLKRKISGFQTLDRTITYHHIVPIQKGGQTTLINGVNLARYNHTWLHQQSEATIEEINELLAQFKFQIDMAKLKVTESGIIVEKENLDIIEPTIYTLPVKNNSQLNEKEYARLMYLRRKANKKGENFYER